MPRNDDERRLWVENDEGLYRLWLRSRRGITIWVRANRKLIDEVMENVLTQKKPPSYLAY